MIISNRVTGNKHHLWWYVGFRRNHFNPQFFLYNNLKFIVQHAARSFILVSLTVSDGTTNNLNEYITMSMDDVKDLESMADDVYSSKHGVVINETILPEFFSRLPG